MALVSGGDIFLESLKVHGVEYIFCSPGTEWAPVWEGLAGRYQLGDKSIQYISCRHESLAVSIAMGYANATGRMAAVLLHASVGPLNAAMAIRTAFRNCVPMLICTADTSGLGEDYMGQDLHWMRFLSDIGGPHPLLKPYVKWSNVITSKETLLDSLYRGFQIALTPPRGPVFLTIPRELMLRQFSELGTPRSLPSAKLPGPQHHDLEEVAKQLVESRLPIIITEYAGKSPNAVENLVELAELLSIPVFESRYPVVDNFPKNHPLHMGYNALETLKEVDTVLVVGATTPWYPPSAFPQNGPRVILLDEDPLKEQLPFWGYPVEFYLTANIGEWLADLVHVLHTHLKQLGHEDSRYKTRFERWRKKHNQLVENWKAEAYVGQGNRPLSPKWFLYKLNEILPGNAIVVEETITHRQIINRYITAPDRIVRACAGGLGVGLGVTAGEKLAYQGRPVVLLVGDGCFNYNPVVAGLGLCQEYQLPILIIILNNGGYVSIKGSHQESYPEGSAVRSDIYFGASIVPDPGYAKLAEAFDAYGARLEEPNEMEPALKKSLEQLAVGRSALLDVVLDPTI